MKSDLQRQAADWPHPIGTRSSWAAWGKNAREACFKGTPLLMYVLYVLPT